ncbi:MAG TPA: ADP-ribosylglycohydrolase family protein [Nocardioidaceae bacterium]|nr:ADP-ribosylglycohydrolase family protein [Nocardioidaceae bacterium]
MELTTVQRDRAAGVLLGQAAGDALGVPYEFGAPPGPGEQAEMRGGGLIHGAPGEWSDDTAMAVAVARVAVEHRDLASPDALSAVARGFLGWYAGRPADIGVQTRAVLASVAEHSDDPMIGRLMREAAAAYAAHHPHSAGNGALMRTSPVALASLDDREQTARAARAVAELTHADPLAGDSCVLWSEAVRVAVLEGGLAVDAGLDLLPRTRRGQWRAWLDEARSRPPSTFRPNGFTVTALQAAVAAITQTGVPDLEPARHRFPCLHLQEALHAAVRIGDDTDTVAAIAGGLLGARWGASAVPWHWRRVVHGWPGLRSRDLQAFGTSIADHMVPTGWPQVDAMDYPHPASEGTVPHPHDEGVLLGTMRSLDHGTTAIVSLCRVGTDEPLFGRAAPEDRIDSRLVDSSNAAENANLHFLLHDAASAVRGLRAEGHTVLLHCVAAQQRTPSVALAYAVLLGHDPVEAAARVRAELPSTRGHGRVWDAAQELGSG